MKRGILIAVILLLAACLCIPHICAVHLVWDGVSDSFPAHERAEWLTNSASEFRNDFLLSKLRMQPHVIPC